MKTLLHRMLTVAIVAAVQIGRSHSYTDPVANLCSPLCQEETTLEEQCATSRGCYDLDESDDADRYIACWKPCWDVAGKCFSLCAEEFDDLLQRCYNVCTSTPDDLTCISSCFNQCFLKLKHDLLDDLINFTLANSTTSSPSSPLSLTTVASLTETSKGPKSPTVDPDTIDQIVQTVEVIRSERDNLDTPELDALLAYLYLNVFHSQQAERSFKSDHSHSRPVQFISVETTRDVRANSVSTDLPVKPGTRSEVTDQQAGIGAHRKHISLKPKQVAMKKGHPAYVSLSDLLGKVTSDDRQFSQNPEVKRRMSPESQAPDLSDMSSTLTGSLLNDTGLADKVNSQAVGQSDHLSSTGPNDTNSDTL